ncbi:unknown protein [Seminavis robusta]|uniref:Uncharacterized protein n=1 Tax=Seminavis robusta TaxID=568900 RepID=A0A9N8HXT7_9STRA|nr:unknown protein [Seminavis robusta]|eukprot:Sro3331_g346890.1 n/a (136) ;mRNA; f:6656-7063
MAELTKVKEKNHSAYYFWGRIGKPQGNWTPNVCILYDKLVSWITRFRRTDAASVDFASHLLILDPTEKLKLKPLQRNEQNKRAHEDEEDQHDEESDDSPLLPQRPRHRRIAKKRKGKQPLGGDDDDASSREAEFR